MATYLVDCIDGSEPDCWGELEIDIAIEGLSGEQLKEIIEHGNTYITREQLQSSGRELNPADEAVLKENGRIEVVIEIDPCGACDPSDTDDSEGNTITAA